MHIRLTKFHFSQKIRLTTVPAKKDFLLTFPDLLDIFQRFIDFERFVCVKSIAEQNFPHYKKGQLFPGLLNNFDGIHNEIGRGGVYGAPAAILLKKNSFFEKKNRFLAFYSCACKARL